MVTVTTNTIIIKCYDLQDKTRGPWATSLTWETFSIIKQIGHDMMIKWKNNIISLLWKMNGPYLLKFKSPSHKDACTKLCWNWPSGSWEKDFFKISSMYFHYFIVISFWKTAWPFIWKKLEYPLPKDALCQFWLKLVQWFLRIFF